MCISLLGLIISYESKFQFEEMFETINILLEIANYELNPRSEIYMLIKATTYTLKRKHKSIVEEIREFKLVASYFESNFTKFDYHADFETVQVPKKEGIYNRVTSTESSRNWRSVQSRILNLNRPRSRESTMFIRKSITEKPVDTFIGTFSERTGEKICSLMEGVNPPKKKILFKSKGFRPKPKMTIRRSESCAYKKVNMPEMDLAFKNRVENTLIKSASNTKEINPNEFNSQNSRMMDFLQRVRLDSKTVGAYSHLFRAKNVDPIKLNNDLQIQLTELEVKTHILASDNKVVLKTRKKNAIAPEFHLEGKAQEKQTKKKRWVDIMLKHKDFFQLRDFRKIKKFKLRVERSKNKKRQVKVKDRGPSAALSLEKRTRDQKRKTSVDSEAEKARSFNLAKLVSVV